MSGKQIRRDIGRQLGALRRYKKLSLQKVSEATKKHSKECFFITTIIMKIVKNEVISIKCDRYCLQYHKKVRITRRVIRFKGEKSGV